MPTVVQPATWINQEDGPPIIQAVGIFAAALEPGMLVTNIGSVVKTSRVGVFVVASIRGTVWSLAEGLGDVHVLDVVWHEAELVSVDKL